MFDDNRYQSEKGVHDDDEPIDLFDIDDAEEDEDYEVGGFIEDGRH